MDKCFNCGEEIPINHVQIGGVHMHCERAYFHDRMKVIKIRPKGEGTWLIQTPEELVSFIKDSTNDTGKWDMEIAEMTKAEFAKLDEFDGW